MADKNDKYRRWAAERREELIVRSGDKCERCHKGFTEVNPARIHHIVYKKEMGALMYVCDACHRSIHVKQDQKAFLRKLLDWLKDHFPDDYTIKQLKWEAKAELEELGKDKDVP